MKVLPALVVSLTAWALLVAPQVAAQAPVAPSAASAASVVHVQLLGLNDFHGQLDSAKKLDDRPVGGAAVLVSYLRDAEARYASAFPKSDTLIIHAGDWVGASPPSSALLQDEPSIEVLNLLANPSCTRANRMNPRCNLVGTPGNHEFDEGIAELLRLVRGGKAARGPFLEDPYRGTRFPYVSATVVDARTGVTVFPPFVIKQVSGIKLGVIGAVLQETPSMVVAAGVQRVRFLPEAEAINRQVTRLKKRGIETIIVTIHQGGPQTPYAGPTRAVVAGPTEGIPPILAELDDAVDVVITGHAHSFTNALMKNKNGHPILVTQAWLAGGAFAAIDLTIDKQTRDVIAKSATIIPTYGDAGPGLTPAADVAALVKRADERVAPLAAEVVGKCTTGLPQKPNDAGESALGNLIADAQRSVMGAQIALMNQGGIRSGLGEGAVTWGSLFAIQPFSNAVMAMDLTGTQVLQTLEQQWPDKTSSHMLQVSGISYVWDPASEPGRRVVSAQVNGRPLGPSMTYRVAVNSFLAGGGSGFTVLRDGKNLATGPLDLDVLVTYIELLGRRISTTLEGRIKTASK